MKPLQAARRPQPPKVGRSAEATVRVSTVMAVPEVLKSLGVNAERVLAEAGFDMTQFDDPDTRISHAARGRLLAHCARRTGCPHFGLLVGQKAGLDSLGLVGLLVKYSPDVDTALQSLVRYLHLHVGAAAPSLVVAGKVAALGYSTHQPNAEATDQLGAGAVALIFNILRALCGPEFEALEARFAHRRPDDVGPYRRFFRAPLVFDAEQNTLLFAAQWLHRPLPAADAQLQRQLQKQIDSLESRHADKLAEQVRSVLRTALLTGHAKADQVAALFSLRGRTFARRLEGDGTSFQQLLDESRFEIARQLLEDSSMAIRQIADSLDYADASAFTRAFRRWSGSTPARWRSIRKAGRPQPVRAAEWAPP